MKSKIFKIDSQYIDEFAKPINPNFVNEVFLQMTQKLSDALDEIKNKSTLINSYSFKLVNECSMGTEVQSSTLDIFLNIKSPQLEFSVIDVKKNFFKKFFNRIKLAIYQIKMEKLSKKKKNKKTKKESKDSQIDFSNINKNYDLVKFKRDFIKILVKYFTEKTTLYENYYGLSILSKEELGLNANIYIIMDNGKNYKIFNSNSYKYTIVDFGQRFSNFEIKNYETNYMYQKIVRIFNSMFANYIGYVPNQIFVESMFYNCPTNLFNGETLKDCFLKIINFINIKLYLQNFTSITNEKINISKDILAKINYYDFNKFFKILQEAL